MTERGIFQRAVDRAVDYSREHKGMSASGGLIAGSAAVEASPVPGKEIVAIPMLLVGAVVGMASSFVEYYDRVIAPYLRRTEPSLTQPVGSFHKDETTIMTAEELQSALTASAKEGAPPA